jgi:hypothetical protein
MAARLPQKLIFTTLSMSFGILCFGIHSDAAAQVITEIVDATGDGSGDGGGNTLNFPVRVAVAPSGKVYVTGYTSSNAFQIDPDGTITEIIDATGDGSGNPLTNPQVITVDDSGDVYLTALNSHNAFRIEFPSCPTSPPSCETSPKSLLLYKQHTTATKSLLKYKFAKGDTLAERDNFFPDPTTTATYTLCLYVADPLSDLQDLPAGLSDGTVGWSDKTTKWQWQNKTAPLLAASGNTKSVKLQAGKAAPA